MRAFCKAVAARWSALMPAGLPLFDEEAPVGQSLPYALFSTPAGMQDFSFSGPSSDTVLVQFDVYAKDRIEAWGYFEGLTSAFDDCDMPVDGLELMKMERGPWLRDRERGACRMIVPYTVQLQPL